MSKILPVAIVQVLRALVAETFFFNRIPQLLRFQAHRALGRLVFCSLMPPVLTFWMQVGVEELAPPQVRAVVLFFAIIRQVSQISLRSLD